MQIGNIISIDPSEEMLTSEYEQYPPVWATHDASFIRLSSELINPLLIHNIRPYKVIYESDCR